MHLKALHVRVHIHFIWMLSFGSTNTARVCLAIVVYCAVTKLSAAAHKYTWNVKYKTSCIQCNPFWTSNSKKLNGKHIEHRWKQNHHIDSESESWDTQRLSECVCVFIFVCLRCWKASNQQCVPCIQRKCSRSCYHLCIVFFYIKRKSGFSLWIGCVWHHSLRFYTYMYRPCDAASVR